MIVNSIRYFETWLNLFDGEELNEEGKQGLAQALVSATSSKGADKVKYDYVVKNGVFKQIKKEK